MSVKNWDDLKKIREEAKALISQRDTGDKAVIIIGMGTCGIAAGAREVMAAILEELDKRKIDAVVTQTGCIGMCEKEVLVDIKRPGERRITYGNVKPVDVSRIIQDHVQHGKIVEDLLVAALVEE